MAREIDKIYGNRVRVRVCGLCWRDSSLLMVNHKNITANNFWAPPGGGIEFGETAEEALIRELQEETGIRVTIGKFLFLCEFIHQPLHAVELFFEITGMNSELRTGYDPEMHQMGQIIDKVGFINFNDILTMDEHERHGLFRCFKTEKELKTASGYIKI